MYHDCNVALPFEERPIMRMRYTVGPEVDRPSMTSADGHVSVAKDDPDGADVTPMLSVPWLMRSPPPL